MFGGWGLSCEGKMFGLVAYDQLYLKVDDHNRESFESVGSGPFIWTGGEKPMAMSYWSLPDSAFLTVEAMAPWAKLGLEAATRQASSKPPKRKR
jgi:DNA transformation protein